MFLTGKPTVKRPLGTPGRIWEGNVRMDLEEIKYQVINWNQTHSLSALGNFTL